MTEQYKSLTLNGKFHSEKELLRLAGAYSSEFVVAGWEKQLFQFIGEWISDLAYIEVQSSGSTGDIKYFQAEKAKMAESAIRTGKFLDLKNGDKALLCLPLSYIAGKMMVVRAFVLGLDLVAVNPSSDPLEEVNHSVDFAAMTPMQVHQVLKTEQGEKKLKGIAKLLVGGGDISKFLMDHIRRLTIEVWHTYGMAETLTHVAMKKLTGSDAYDYFRALPGISFGQDERGCLVIKASWLQDDPVITNDLVELIDDNSFNFLGRIDNIINSGGIKISPESVESKLAPFIDGRFIVTGLPDEVLGQKVVLVLEGKSTSTKSIERKISLAGLDKYEIPREIRFLYHFPDTGSGKILRQQVKVHLSRD